MQPIKHDAKSTHPPALVILLALMHLRVLSNLTFFSLARSYRYGLMVVVSRLFFFSSVDFGHAVGASPDPRAFAPVLHHSPDSIVRDRCGPFGPLFLRWAPVLLVVARVYMCSFCSGSVSGSDNERCRKLSFHRFGCHCRRCCCRKWCVVCVLLGRGQSRRNRECGSRRSSGSSSGGGSGIITTFVCWASRLRTVRVEQFF